MSQKSQAKCLNSRFLYIFSNRFGIVFLHLYNLQNFEQGLDPLYISVVPYAARDVPRGDGVSRCGGPPRAADYPGRFGQVFAGQQGRAHDLSGLQRLGGYPAQASHAAQHIQQQ